MTDFEKIVNRMDQIILLTGPSLKLNYANQQARTELSLGNEETWTLEALTDLVWLRQEDRVKLTSSVANEIPIRLPAFLRNPKDPAELFEKEMRCSPLGFGENGIKLFLFEIRESKTSSIEMQTIQSLGKVASDIAHGISNPLAVIQINCENLKLSLESTGQSDDKNLLSKTEKIASATERVTDQNSRLKKISRNMLNASSENINVLLNFDDDNLGH